MPSHGRIRRIDPSIARTIAVVIVDDATRLEMRIDRRGAQVFETAFPKVLADSCGEAITHGNPAFRMAVVEDGLPFREAPEIVAE